MSKEIYLFVCPKCLDISDHTEDWIEVYKGIYCIKTTKDGEIKLTYSEGKCIELEHKCGNEFNSYMIENFEIRVTDDGIIEPIGNYWYLHTDNFEKLKENVNINDIIKKYM